MSPSKISSDATPHQVEERHIGLSKARSLVRIDLIGDDYFAKWIKDIVDDHATRHQLSEKFIQDKFDEVRKTWIADHGLKMATMTAGEKVAMLEILPIQLEVDLEKTQLFWDLIAGTPDPSETARLKQIMNDPSGKAQIDLVPNQLYTGVHNASEILKLLRAIDGGKRKQLLSDMDQTQTVVKMMGDLEKELKVLDEQLYNELNKFIQYCRLRNKHNDNFLSVLWGKNLAEDYSPKSKSKDSERTKKEISNKSEDWSDEVVERMQQIEKNLQMTPSSTFEEYFTMYESPTEWCRVEKWRAEKFGSDPARAAGLSDLARNNKLGDKFFRYYQDDIERQMKEDGAEDPAKHCNEIWANTKAVSSQIDRLKELDQFILKQLGDRLDN